MSKVMLSAAMGTSPDPDMGEQRPNVNYGTALQTVLSSDLKSLSLTSDVHQSCLSFLLMDCEENVLVGSDAQLAMKLGCDTDTLVKVVSIFGNAGEGKSYTLNRLFFSDLLSGGDPHSYSEEVFVTSSSHDSCTLGVWAAYDPHSSIIAFDTEGLLGTVDPKSATDGHLSALNENKRKRLLLKILALSDVVIYKTRAERLQSDLFYFLGDAAKAYDEHFSSELQKVSRGATKSLGPDVVIFHETRFTDVLMDSLIPGSSPELIIRDRLAALGQDVTAFSKLQYYGAKREDRSLNEQHVYSQLKSIVRNLIDDSSVRSPRSVGLIYHTLQSLNVKFSGNMSGSGHRSFPDEYFSCQARCASCGGRCVKQMNHESGHVGPASCIYQKSHDNKQLLCLRCYQNGRKVIVVPKTSSSRENTWVGLASYAWSGYVLECRICGVIYRSRQHWYGNESPEAQEVVHGQVVHVWPGTRPSQGTQNAARKILDGVNSLSETVTSLSSTPAKSVSGWVADQIAPSYWRPNSDISHCFKCDVRFQGQLKIHHCRACGEGFCDRCSDYWRPVPERGWGNEAVRVCMDCSLSRPSGARDGPEAVQARKYGEKVVDTLNILAQAMLEYPINVIKDSVRPDYWVPDEECTMCAVCSAQFEGKGCSPASSLQSSSLHNGPFSAVRASLVRLHHCRQCGQGVCDACSKTRKPVPLRGWDQPVRVCDSCKNLPSPSSL